MVAIQVLLRSGYKLQHLPKGTDLLHLTTLGIEQPIIVVLKMKPTQTDHVICISGREIIDGSHEYSIDLNRDNLNWCCG